MEQVIQTESPVKLEIAYPETSSRGLALITILGIKFIILIPVIIVLYIFQIIAMVVMIVGIFAVLFTAKYPRGLFDFMVQMLRWTMEINVYSISMSDKYPPFTPQ